MTAFRALMVKDLRILLRKRGGFLSAFALGAAGKLGSVGSKAANKRRPPDWRAIEARDVYEFG